VGYHFSRPVASSDSSRELESKEGIFGLKVSLQSHVSGTGNRREFFTGRGLDPLKLELMYEYLEYALDLESVVKFTLTGSLFEAGV